MKKQKVKIKKVISQTPCKMHSWCDSNIGIIRKPNSSIPSNLLIKKHG